MSQPPSRSPDSLTGASAEISALQLVERRGDGGTEGGWGGGREMEGGRDGVSEREGQGEEEKARRGRVKEWEVEKEEKGKWWEAVEAGCGRGEVNEERDMRRKCREQEGEEG